MKVDWSQLLRSPQTYALVVGALAGFGGLVLWLGARPVVWLSGGGIAGVMTLGWASGYRQSMTALDSSDLLTAASFEQQLRSHSAKVPHPSSQPWQQAHSWAAASQSFAHQIATQEPLLRSDLLEALHTVLDLARQVAEALQVIDKVQTPVYRQMAQQRLQASCDRLQATYQQLQQLQDQVALSSLETGPAALPERLKLIIAANRQSLEPPAEDS
ncbi:MAG: hypothetical protein F6J97_24190 [Leptolyngbya sp. SIO4C1]|nr:hypothetical protein [Leptolyngbya sp. SIO4C1]